MKKNIKNYHARRITSLLIVLCMVLTIVPITAFAGVTDVTGGGTSTSYQHTYHTQIDTTAQVTIKDADGNVKETTSVNKSGDFIEGNLLAEAVQAEITRIDDEIKAQFSSRGTAAIENRDENLVFDHFESGNILDDDGNVTTKLDVHEYQVYKITYNLWVQEQNVADEVITTVDIGNVWKNLDSSQPVAFTAEVNPNSECANQMALTDEYWQHMVIDGDRIEKSNPQKPIAGETYSYAVKLTAKDGYYFHDGFKGSGVGCTVICDGSTTTAFASTLSDDRKQLTLWFNDIKVTATDGSSQDSIGDVDIEGVTFNYEPGDAPKATAYKCDPWEEQYDIEYEYWEEMETNADGESVPVKFWYSDESKNNALAQDKKITTFEEGKTYMYSISLKAREGNTFATNSKVMVNGTNVNGANVSNTGTGLFVVAVRTIKPETLQWENISVVEINNAAISFNVGDKPVFTGKTPENVPYIYQTEFWSTDGGEKYYYSADFWNDNNPDDLFTEFESGKTYTYGIYFKAAEGYCFTTDTKLKINGKYYDYDTSDYDPMLQYPNGGYATMWVDTNLTITPTAAGDSDYKIIEGANGTWTQNSDGTLTFRANGDFSKFTGVKVDGTLIDAKNYTAVSGSTVITLKADYLKTLSGGTHKITVVYTDGECSANFEVKKAASEQTKPTEGDKADTTTPTGGKDTTSPQTGDNSNLALWFAVLFVSGAGALGTTVYSKRKKRME